MHIFAYLKYFLIKKCFRRTETLLHEMYPSIRRCFTMPKIITHGVSLGVGGGGSLMYSQEAQCLWTASNSSNHKQSRTYKFSFFKSFLKIRLGVFLEKGTLGSFILLPLCQATSFKHA